MNADSQINLRQRLRLWFDSPQTKNRLSIAFLVALPPVFFWRETLGWLTLGDQDAVFWFFPAYKFAAEQIRTGSFPLWNPYQYGGVPFFAEWQSGTLDPLNWIHWLGASSRTLTLSIQLSFVVALLAMFSYSRSIGFTRRASIFAAVIFGLSGFLVGRTLYPGFVRIVALMPLVLCFTERLRQRGRWRDAVFGALIIAWQIFAAHPQPLIYSSLLACAYALFRLQRGSRRLRFLAQFSLMFIAGIGLAAIQLFPAFEFATKSVRQDWPFELFTLHSLHPASLLVTLFPFFHGSGRTIYELPYWGTYWHHNEAQIYLGLLALSLALAGMIAAWRARHRVGIFWGLIAVAGMILSLGKYSGFVAKLLYHVPLISHFRSPNRHWMEVSMAVAVLAGYAVNRLLKEKSRFIARGSQLSAALLTLLIFIVGGFALWQTERSENLIRRMIDLHHLPQGFLQTARWEFLLPMITSAIACLLIFIFTKTANRARWFAMLLAVLLIDFNLYAAFAPINNPAKLESLVGTAMPSLLAARQSEREPIRYQMMLNVATGEFSPFWLYGNEMMTGYDPVLSERQKVFSGLDEAGRCFNLTMLEAQDRTLDVFNARFVFVPPGFMKEELTSNKTRWREVIVERDPTKPYADYRVFENLRAMPRVWLVSTARTEWEGDQLKLMRGQLAGFDPLATVLVDHETSAKLDSSLFQTASASNDSTGKASIINRSPIRMTIETEATKASLLILSEMFYPGWKALIDGREVEVLRVNYNLRGVSIPAGKHLVEFSYRPKSITIGAAITWITALCLIAILILENRRLRRIRDAGV